MNFGEMKAELALNLNNMQSSDPFYSRLGRWLNEGANRIITMAIAKDKKALQLFPELKNRRWWDTTVANQNYLDLPDSLLALEFVTYTKTTAAFDASRHTEFPSSETSAETFAFLSKSATTVGWPSLHTRRGNRLAFHPTPTTAYLTVVVLNGIRKEDTLIEDTQTYAMNETWHPTVVKAATALGNEALGWPDAERWWAAADRDLGGGVNREGLERRKDTVQIRIEGAPWPG
jgi:hypothetical protein